MIPTYARGHAHPLMTVGGYVENPHTKLTLRADALRLARPKGGEPFFPLPHPTPALFDGGQRARAQKYLLASRVRPTHNFRAGWPNFEGVPLYTPSRN